MSAAVAPAAGTALDRDYEAVADCLLAGQRFLLTGHRNPDGDTLGSALALARALERSGKEARVVTRDSWSAAYRWLPGIEKVDVLEALPPEWPAAFDALLTLECPDGPRTGFPGLELGRVVNIDHHPGNTRYGQLNLVDVRAAAAGEIVADLLDFLDWPLDESIATNLWVSLVSDTGSFRYSSTTAKALALGARLVAAGVRPGEVNELLFETRPERALKLEALVLGTLELHDEGRVATLELPSEFLSATGALSSDAEGLVNRARGVEGVRAAVLLSEQGDGEIGCSLRSKGGIDVRRVAVLHGGGGHRNASGCTVRGSTLEACKALLVPELAATVAETDGAA